MLLIVAGLLGIVLPVFGFWMVIPGLLLLAIDLPFLRVPMRMAIVRTRHALRKLRFWYRSQRRS
ncbi:MAG: hypothetical protein J0H27_02440 [Xanthomonadales bacterium]|nr:hypothetical protein [Xanthomonadales bacterium]